MRRIIIVDDDTSNLEILSDIFQKDCQVQIYKTGTQFMQNLDQANMPDLLLMSYSLPDQKGSEILRRLRRNESMREIPVVMLMKEQERMAEPECMEAGAEDFFIKPLVAEIVRSRVDRILELSALREELEEALKDPLTGMYNRSYAEKQVKAYLAEHEMGAYFMIDLDNFKHVNDVYGHVAGDCTLRYVADILVRTVGSNGIACRMGGDEFSLFFYKYKNRKQLAGMALDILNEYNRTAVENDNMTGTSLSIGISLVGKDGTTYEELYNAADKALYFSKRNGKNSYYFYSSRVSAEDDCHESVVDIYQLERLIQDRKNFAGSYQVNYKEFQRIYNFIQRCVERTHQKAQLMLVSLKKSGDDGEVLEIPEAEIQNLEHAIVNSLRRNDVSTHYGNCQFLVVLIDMDEGNMNIVRGRICEHYAKLQKDGCYNVVFEQMPIEGIVQS